MNPAKVSVYCLLLSVLGLAACGKQEQTQAPAEVVRPVKTMLIQSADAGAQRSFAGRVEAANRATLSFQVSGKLNEILVKEGEKVVAGQTLARLDPKDLQLVVNDRTANFRRTEADFKRAEELVEKGHVSRSDFDKLRAAYQSASAALDQARNDLSYTELKAPFDGTVSRRLVENFEQVNAKQTVFELRDLQNLEIKFDVPENLTQRIQRKAQADPGQGTAGRVYAGFEGLPDQRFELTFKEAATQADDKTQTFEVTFTMPRPSQLQILPGMTAKVSVDLSGIVDASGARQCGGGGQWTCPAGLAGGSGDHDPTPPQSRGRQDAGS